MGHPGLEPGTNRLKAEYSTIELVTRMAYLARRLLRYQQDTQIATNFGDYYRNEPAPPPTAIFLARSGNRNGSGATQ
jgi:hypothetical protein